MELSDARQKISELQSQLAAASSSSAAAAAASSRSVPSSSAANGSSKKEKDDWDFLEKNIYAAEMTSAKLGSYQIPAAAAAITHHLLGNRKKDFLFSIKSFVVLTKYSRDRYERVLAAQLGAHFSNAYRN